MKTLKFSKVLEKCALACGITPSSDDYTVQFMELLTSWINQILPEQGWYRHRWADIVRVEERQFAADYDASTAYTEGQIVYYDSTYWEALQASTGQTPAAGSAYWEETTDYDLQIAFAQAWASNAIDRFATVTDRDPRKSRAPFKYMFKVDADGAWLTSQCSSKTVWVKFWPACPEFTSTAWDEGTTYAADDLVFSETDGECYKAVEANTAQDPSTDTTETYWAKVEFPKILLEWMLRAVRAEYLRFDNQDDKVELAEETARRAMFDTYTREVPLQDQDDEVMRASGYGVGEGAI